MARTPSRRSDKCISIKFKDFFKGLRSILDGLEAFIIEMIASIVECF
jgi:hypothetical protein